MLNVSGNRPIKCAAAVADCFPVLANKSSDLTRGDGVHPSQVIMFGLQRNTLVLPFHVQLISIRQSSQTALFVTLVRPWALKLVTWVTAAGKALLGFSVEQLQGLAEATGQQRYRGTQLRTGLLQGATSLADVNNVCLPSPSSMMSCTGVVSVVRTTVHAATWACMLPALVGQVHADSRGAVRMRSSHGHTLPGAPSIRVLLMQCAGLVCCMALLLV